MPDSFNHPPLGSTPPAGSPADALAPDPAFREVLIARVVDGRAAAADWRSLEQLALTDPAVWRDLAHSQRDQALLERVVGRAAARAEAFDLPAPNPIHHTPPHHAGRDLAHPAHRFRRAVAWMGWAAAACLALAYAGSFNNQGILDANQATVVPSMKMPSIDQLVATPQDALDLYLDKGARAGRVVRELPTRVFVEATPAADGGYEVLFLRQILERTHVPDLYRLSTDEAGRPAPIPVTVAPAPAAPPPSDGGGWPSL